VLKLEQLSWRILPRKLALYKVPLLHPFSGGASALPGKELCALA
jgi:hypothetical protein